MPHADKGSRISPRSLPRQRASRPSITAFEFKAFSNAKCRFGAGSRSGRESVKSLPRAPLSPIAPTIAFRLSIRGFQWRGKYSLPYRLLANPSSKSEGSSGRFRQLLQPDGRSPSFPLFQLLFHETHSFLRCCSSGGGGGRWLAALPECRRPLAGRYGLLSWGPFYKEPFNIMLP